MSNGIDLELGTATPDAWLDVDGFDIYAHDGTTRWFFLPIAARPVGAGNEGRILEGELGFSAA
jgi:hypothetical protein